MQLSLTKKMRKKYFVLVHLDDTIDLSFCLLSVQNKSKTKNKSFHLSVARFYEKYKIAKIMRYTWGKWRE